MLYRELKEGERISEGDFIVANGITIEKISPLFFKSDYIKGVHVPIFRPVKAPSFEEVKVDLSNRYQIGDDDDCENCEEHMRRVYKATLKLMGLEQTDGK
jgi:hypothetical protein